MTQHTVRQLRPQVWSQTDVGRKRKHNEDSLVINPQLGLYGVADGMGGHDFGDVASQTSLQVTQEELGKNLGVIRDLLRTNTDDSRRGVQEFLEQSIVYASDFIYKMSLNKAGARGMGTTLSVSIVHDRFAYLGHVGDSRIYLLRSGVLRQLTDDHSFVAEQVRMGLITEEEAESHPFRNMITRAVGASETLEVDTRIVELEAGDKLLVCSDGMHGYFSRSELQEEMNKRASHLLCDYLVDESNRRGGKDNITVVLVEMEEVEVSRDTVPEATTQSDAGKVDTEVTLRMDLLRSIPLFQHMTYPELVKLMNITYMRTYTTADQPYREEDQGEMLFIILQGIVSLYRKGHKLSMLGAGRHFGEISLLDKGPRCMSVVVEEPAQLLTIARRDLIRLMRKEKDIAVKVMWALLKDMSTSLRQTTMQFVDNLDNHS